MPSSLKTSLRVIKRAIWARLAAPPGPAPEAHSTIFLNKAVIVRVSQGLANQMICYKAAKLIASWQDATVILDASSYGSINNVSGRNFQLHHHRIKYDLLVFDPDFLRKVESTNQVFHVTKGMLYPAEGTPDPKIFEHLRSAPIVCFDFWLSLFLRAEADQYAAASGGLNELTLDYESCFQNQDHACLQAIQAATNPVAIHVRRGDYATHDGGLLLTSAYFNRAIKTIEEALSAPSFFVFSDDIPWCRENLVTSAPVTFVDWNDDSQGHKDLFLGSKCRHFILSNESTYSHQMVQLSGADPNRIVVTSTATDLVKNAG